VTIFISHLRTIVRILLCYFWDDKYSSDICYFWPRMCSFGYLNLTDAHPEGLRVTTKVTVKRPWLTKLLSESCDGVKMRSTATVAWSKLGNYILTLGWPYPMILYIYMSYVYMYMCIYIYYKYIVCLINIYICNIYIHTYIYTLILYYIYIYNIYDIYIYIIFLLYI
jgi:hypothetical protein